MPALSTVLDVVIGIIFVFLVLSLVTTWLQEYVATILKLRTKQLFNVVQNLLNPPAGQLNGLEEFQKDWSAGVDTTRVIAKLNDNAVKAVCEHPIIKSLSQPRQLPSYIASRELVSVLLDLFTKVGTADSPGKAGLEAIRTGIGQLQNTSVKTSLLALVDEAAATEQVSEKKVAAARQSLEDWVDAAMDRATGWYKRQSQIMAVVIGLILAIVLNVDAIGIAQTLWRDSALRNYVAATATSFIEKGDQGNADLAVQKLEALGIPVGWSLKSADGAPGALADPRDFPVTFGGWLAKVAGLLITGLAVSQGAPIWFDLLGQVVNMRQAGKKPDPSSAAAT